MTYDPRPAPRGAVRGDAANNDYVLRTFGGIALWLPSGVPRGGTVGQVLTKLSGIDWDTTWSTPASGGGGGGGGGGGTVKDYRWTTPATGATTIDEFNDDTLAAAWGRVDGANAPAGNVVWTEGADVLSAHHAGADTGNALHAMLQPLSGIGGSMATGDAFATCLRIFGPLNTNYQIGGICLADGNTYGAGKQLLAELFSETAAAGSMTSSLDQFTNFTTGGTSTTDATRRGTYGTPIFTRIVYLGGTTWRMDRSPDGVSWVKGANVTYTFTPTHAGLFVRDAGSGTVSVFSFEFFRRHAGVT